MRLKSLPAGWHAKVQEDSKDSIRAIKTKKMGKSKDNINSSPKSIRNQQYGSFESILEWNNGTYRIKEILP